MIVDFIRGCLLLLLVAPIPISVAAQATEYDVVLAGGRVMDPESRLDAVRHIGIRGDKIAAVSATPLRGRTMVDVNGLVVAPGFIDLHSHAQSMDGNRWQALDGVTTALELEEGAFPVAEWYESRAGQALINFGVSAGHIPARIGALEGARSLGQAHRIRMTDPRPEPDWSHRRATDTELERLERLLREGLNAGGLGIGLTVGESPAASRQEIYRAFRVAAERGVPVYVHLRAMGLDDTSGSLAGFQEMLSNAAATGAAVHFVHLGSSGLAHAPLLVEMMDGARRAGLDVTGEVYPYTAASTLIQTAMFDPGWRERLGITYEDLEWPPTGERLSAATFADFRRQGGWVILHMIPEATVDLLLARPEIMIASDAVPFINGRGHPRGAGTYARVLGRFTRDRQVLSLMDAVRRMSLLPAERVRGAAQAMRHKGRIGVGADADLVVFDAERVIDRATFANPTQASQGIQHVMVNGVFVVRNSALVDGVTPGRPVRGKH